MRTFYKTLSSLLIIIIYLGCSDSSNDPVISEFDGTYHGIISKGGVQLGTYSMVITNGQVAGEYVDGFTDTPFSSTVNPEGIIELDLAVQSSNSKIMLKISGNEITGSWSDSKGNSGTVSGASAHNLYDGEYSGGAYIGSTEIGTFQVIIHMGRLSGTYLEDGITTGLNGFVNTEGLLLFNVNFTDGTIASINAIVTDGSITGTFSNTVGDSGTIKTIEIPVCPTTITDIDGNIYPVITLAGQCWMTENLKTSRYRNGDAIITGLNGDAWASSISGAYAIYDNNPVNDSIYGKLYNWYAVTDPRGLCPEGWHVPTSEEAAILLDSLGDIYTAGGRLKQTGTLENGDGLFLAPNTGATDEFGFTGKPGGIRAWKINIGSPAENGAFQFINSFGVFWTSSEANASSGKVLFSLQFASEYIESVNVGRQKSDGHSCRCIKD